MGKNWSNFIENFSQTTTNKITNHRFSKFCNEETTNLEPKIVKIRLWIEFRRVALVNEMKMDAGAS